MNGIVRTEGHQMHQLISLQSYFYMGDVPSEKNPVDVRLEVVT
jgi:hypothetical protein